ncbi:MAG: bifunctional chorismate mutase/prephenate dehydratase [Sandaracinaceae bacterium]
MSDERELTRIREALAKADEEMVDALDARASAVRAFVELKAKAPDAFFALPSSAEVVSAALERAKEFPPQALERVLREALGACDALIAPIQVTVQGPEGGFAHVAARRYFGSAVGVNARETVNEVFDDVQRRRASFGVVPFETSSDGAIADTLDALLTAEARVCAELTLECSYDLASSTGNAADVDTIYGAHTALVACELTLKAEFPRARVLDVRSGAYAEDLAREDHGAAALVAAFDENDPRGLRRVKARVEDRAGVETRFVIIGHERPRRTGRDITLLALAVGDEPGSLYHALRPFADRGINLTRIESRVARGATWRYVFFLEIDGHMTDRAIVTAVDEVQRTARHLKVLGSFPRQNA